MESILLEFPYLQSARAIYLKGLYNRDSFRYNTELKKTAAYTTDRAVLFDFITSEEFRSIDKKALEDNIKAVSEIVVNDIVTVKDSITPAADKLEESIKLSIKEAVPEDVVIEETQPVADKLEESIKLSIKEATPEDLVTEEILPNKKTPIVTQVAIPTEKTADDAPAEEIKTREETENTGTKTAIGSPLEFSESETHSFAEWLKLSKTTPIERENAALQPVINEILDKKYSLIDKFIEANPKITPVKKDAPTPVNTGKAVNDSPGLMTETLARVYLEQKKYTKAIQAYQILILKYPEKSVFFADRILEVKNLQQNINKEQ